jgi:hypothetical protein
MNKFLIFLCLALAIIPVFAQNQYKLVTTTQKNKLTQLGIDFELKSQKNLKKAYILAKKHHWTTLSYTSNGGVKLLQGVDALERPRYLTTYSNYIASAITRTNTLYAGGSLGIDINGRSENLRNKLAIWDGGAILANHQELNGRTVPKDAASTVVYHATHVAGTMIASGINPTARGMAWGAPNLLVYDFDNDIAEIARAASDLLLSNHSYGYQAGWLQNDDNSWEWLGIIGQNEDYKFGIYDAITHDWDDICYNAPYYLPVVACGNSRSQNGPAIGQPYYGYPNMANTAVLIGNRPEGISNNNGYEIISTPATAKNILTVGAVDGLPAGAQKPSDTQISDFSSWGPTDDGRIKPDIVGQGVRVTSTSSMGTAAYGTISGTSMASPNVSGSLLLLQQYYAQLNQGKFMLAATLKGLALHTTSEAGAAPGPDYVYGWGLLNMEQAANVIKNNGSSSLIIEKNLLQNTVFTQTFVASGLEPVKVTVCWTDPAGTITPDGTLNNNSPKLVNDLDTRLQNDSTTFMPWQLNPQNPAMAATKGDNVLDNVEQIIADDNKNAQIYTLSVSHKGQLVGGSQNFSVLISGLIDKNLNFAVYPVPAADNLTIALNSIKKQNINYSISNASGQKIYEKTINNAIGRVLNTVQVRNFNAGIYFVSVQTDDTRATKKIIIGHHTP